MQILPDEWPFSSNYSPFWEHLPGQSNDGMVTNDFLNELDQINIVESFAKSLRAELEFADDVRFNDHIQQDIDASFLDSEGGNSEDAFWATEFDNDCNGGTQKKKRAPNKYKYEFGVLTESNWYRQFLCPEVWERTYEESEDKSSSFRCLFRMPLTKIEELVELFLSRGWIKLTKHCNDEAILKIKAELLIMSCLHIVGLAMPFRTINHNTNISTSEHRKFFHKFVEKMYSTRDEYISLPKTVPELERIMEAYADKGLPGCIGSIDVVHIKWGNCPAGDANRCKGKENYPSLAWEVISGHNCEVLGISSVQFGTRNDKHIVKIDENVAKIRDGWYNPEGYFSTNLESVHKDVECLFGILKKRWSLLNYGIRFCDIKVSNRIFVTCCILHNIMLKDAQSEVNPDRIRRGLPVDGSGLWLEGASDVPAPTNANDPLLTRQWEKRRSALLEHLHYVCQTKKA